MMRRKQAGMTLIELLIAMSLMALLAILGYRAFASMLIARERLMSTASQWNDLARAFAQVERDVAALAPGQASATVALSSGQLQLSLPSTISADGKEARQYSALAGGLAWGWSNASSGPATLYPLLEASGTHWQIGTQDGAWHDNWPDGGSLAVLLKLNVQLPDGETVQRLWALP